MEVSKFPALRRKRLSRIGTPIANQTVPYKITILLQLSPGDTVVLSAAIRSLHLNYPNQYLVDIDVTAPELFNGNPDITHFKNREESFIMRLSNNFSETNISQQHFIQNHCNRLSDWLRIPITAKTLKPILYLSEEEKNWEHDWGKYVVINSGGKTDMPTKQIGYEYGQQIVDYCLSKGIQPVQIGKSSDTHVPLNGAINLIDKTTIRELMCVISQSMFVVSGVTMVIHLASALNIPAICINAREPTHFVQYPKQITISPVGMGLDCCRESPCWASSFGNPIAAGSCRHPVQLPNGSFVGQCVKMFQDTKAVENIIDQMIASNRFSLPLV